MKWEEVLRHYQANSIFSRLKKTAAWFRSASSARCLGQNSPSPSVRAKGAVATASWTRGSSRDFQTCQFWEGNLPGTVVDRL